MDATVKAAGNSIVILRNNREQARVEIKDAPAPRGEQILRTLTISFPKHWLVLGTDANDNNSVSIQLCSQD